MREENHAGDDPTSLKKGGGGDGWACVGGSVGRPQWKKERISGPGNRGFVAGEGRGRLVRSYRDRKGKGPAFPRSSGEGSVTLTQPTELHSITEGGKKGESVSDLKKKKKGKIVASFLAQRKKEIQSGRPHLALQKKEGKLGPGLPVSIRRGKGRKGKGCWLLPDERPSQGGNRLIINSNVSRG